MSMRKGRMSVIVSSLSIQERNVSFRLRIAERNDPFHC